MLIDNDDYSADDDDDSTLDFVSIVDIAIVVVAGVDVVVDSRPNHVSKRHTVGHVHSVSWNCGWSCCVHHVHHVHHAPAVVVVAVAAGVVAAAAAAAAYYYNDYYVDVDYDDDDDYDEWPRSGFGAVAHVVHVAVDNCRNFAPVTVVSGSL